MSNASQHRIRPWRQASLAVAAATLSLSAWSQDTAPTPMGKWITANGNLEVEVSPCGPALCGTVTRVLGNRSMSPGGGEMKPADTRPALGMQILIDFQPDPDADKNAPRWHGQIYNRENAKTYRCQMQLSPTGELMLHAYVGLPLFGKTQTWRRS